MHAYGTIQLNGQQGNRFGYNVDVSASNGCALHDNCQSKYADFNNLCIDFEFCFHLVVQ